MKKCHEASGTELRDQDLASALGGKAVPPRRPPPPIFEPEETPELPRLNPAIVLGPIPETIVPSPR